ncbi:MAG TPA: MOSC domain-containing protein [Candidatus Binatia bacterium]|nr:MOSC domain-containing protein [Candidatus Binatia bacterium]
MAAVVSIHRVDQRDAPAVALNEATFIAEFGLDGDWRSRKGRARQVTLIEAEALEQVATALGMAIIRAGASRRQVVVRGIALNDTIGKHLRVGPLLLHVGYPCDPCDNMESKIGPGARQAMEARGGVCARVIEGGVLRPGDAVTVL